jgi:glutathione synthase/RimK-type ligase-like ATP-grasp enzyme
MMSFLSEKVETSYLNYLKFKGIFNERRFRYRTHFEKIRKDFYRKLWTDTARELGADIQDVGYGFLNIQLGSKSTLVYNALVMLDDPVTLRKAGNKPLIHKILLDHGFPVIKFVEFNLKSLNKAYDFIQTNKKPGVVKPGSWGAAGNGITTGINSWKCLKRASFKAAVDAHELIIEEQVEGSSYRLLYLNGEFLDALRRHPPHLTGDGKSSIRELIYAENDRRINGEKITSLHPLKIDWEMRCYLKAKGYRLSQVLPKNEIMQVKRVVSQNSSRENQSVNSDVHPDTIKMGSEIAKLLNIQLAGIDVMTEDITRPLSEANGVINEVNTTPGLHHHYLVFNEDEITPVASMVIKHLLNL